MYGLPVRLAAQWLYCREPIHDFERELYGAVTKPRDWAALAP
jgi:hypothetical protein